MDALAVLWRQVDAAARRCRAEDATEIGDPARLLRHAAARLMRRMRDRAARRRNQRRQ